MISRSFIRKDKQVGLRLSESEYVKVSALAKQAGLSMSSFICELVKVCEPAHVRGVQSGARTMQISVRFTDTEFESLNQKASEKGANVQNYIRTIIKMQDVPHNVLNFQKTK